MNSKKSIKIMDDYAIIDISTNKYPDQHCLIDLEDVDKISKISWCYIDGKRAYGGSYKQHLMHRYIIGAKKGDIVDHINGNSLDNRKINLRFVTHQQNMWNNNKQKKIVKSKTGTKYVGVSISPISFKCNIKKPYVARMTINKKTVNLGYFETAEKAHEEYLKKAIEIKGEYFRNNDFLKVNT